MLIGRRSCFLHIPKTGGSWVKAALQASGMRFEEYFVDGDDAHAELRQCPRPELFKYAFVRHPAEFYRSFWRYKMTVGWDFRNELEQRCHSPHFAAFVRAVLDFQPAWASQTYEAYVGPPGGEIDFIGRQEQLVDDLVRALRAAGEEFDEAALRGCQPVNESSREFVAEYTPALLAAVCRSEWQALERFGYQRSRQP